jgi:hypothetical protein
VQALALVIVGWVGFLPGKEWVSWTQTFRMAGLNGCLLNGVNCPSDNRRSQLNGSLLWHAVTAQSSGRIARATLATATLPVTLNDF